MNSARVFSLISTTLLFLLIFLYFFHPITHLTGDLSYYLKIGEVIYQTKTIPDINLFSYTHPTFPFINTNWLSEVLFYIVVQIFGFNGLTILSLLLILTTFAFLFTFAVKKTAIFPAVLVGLIYVQILFERTDAKPELFSYFFLALSLTILYAYRERFTKWIFLLPLLFLFWVNMHIYFFIGIIVLIIFLLDVMIAKKSTLNSKKSLILFGVSIGSILLTLVNPNVIKGATYPLFVFTNYGFTVEENISYFQAISTYTNSTFLFFGIAVALLWICIFFARKKLSPADLMLALFFTCCGFFAVRMFPLFVIGTFIPCAIAVAYIFHLCVKKIKPQKHTVVKVTLFASICLLVSPTILTNLKTHGVGFGVQDSSHDAVTFLEKNTIKGPLYNNYDIGNYLAYRLYPKEKVFVDARPEAYPKSFFENTYFPMQTSQEKFEEISNQYKLNVLFINHSAVSNELFQQLAHLSKNPQWKIVYLDSSIILFIKDTNQNQKIIKKYLITEKSVKINTADLDDNTNVKQLANLFRALEWKQQQLEMYKRSLQLNPNDCAVLYNIAFMLDQQKSPEADIYVYRYQNICK